MDKSRFKRLIFGGLFLIPFIPFLVSSSFFFPFITTKAFAFRIMVEIIFAAWIVLGLLDKDYRPSRSNILYALAIFLAIIGISDLLGSAPLKSFWSNYERMEGFVALTHLGMFFVVIGSVFQEIDWRRWWNTSLAAAFLMVLYSLMQLIGVFTIHQGGVRVDGTLGNASYLAVYMLVHFFLAIFLLAREWNNQKLKWVYGSLAALFAVIIYFTATRGAILGLLGGILLMAVLNLWNRKNQSWRRAGAWIAISVIILVSGFIAVRNASFVRQSPVLERLASITGAELKTGGRSYVWPMAIAGIKEKPILGWGQENFSYVFNKHYQPEMYLLEPWFDRAHNIFLDWGVSGGILGLASYLALYLLAFISIWRKQTNFNYAEKTILSGLIAAYFFHNLFVFDHLVSYMLFFSLLAYCHHNSKQNLFFENKVFSPVVTKISIVVIAGLTLVSLYFVNTRPILANAKLIEALISTQQGDIKAAVGNHKKAYEGSRLGRPEAVEQIVSNSIAILSSNLSIEEKNDFFNFVKSALESQIEETPTDARYRIFAGMFLSRTGQFDQALEELRVAQELTPGKQLVYFEIGNALFGKGDTQGALAEFQKAYQLAPQYLEAKILYLVGVIYAGGGETEKKLLAELPEEARNDPRIVAAYQSVGRTGP